MGDESNGSVAVPRLSTVMVECKVLQKILDDPTTSKTLPS